MENLNNGQLVLLAILVSFVTSIATGIFTVTLLDQAPEPITNTISKVVQTTVEKVIPTEKTIVEKIVVGAGGELVREAIARGEKGIFEVVALKEEGGETVGFKKEHKSIGFFINKEGLLLSRVSPVGASLYVPIREAVGETLIPLDVVAYDEKLGLALFRPNTGTTTPASGEEESPSYPAILIADTGGNVGQTALVLNGSSVLVSFLSGLIGNGEDVSYELFLNKGNNLSGAIVMDVENHVIGILDDTNNLIPSSLIKKFVDESGKGEEKKGAPSV